MFKLISGLTLGLNVALTIAQTYEGFIYQTNNPMIVNYRDVDASWSAGDSLSADETTSPPQVGFPYGREGTSEVSNKDLVLIMLDSDSNSLNGSTSTLNLLHSGLKRDQELTQTDDYLFYIVRSKEAPEAKYLPPAPEEGSGVHNYTLLLFEQPEEGFTLPEEYAKFLPNDASIRTGFTLEEFVEDTGLGEPFAATYFTETAYNLLSIISIQGMRYLEYQSGMD